MGIETLREAVRARINAASDAAHAKFRHAVRPIYGASHRGEPNQIGSALLLQIPEGHILVTAAHVIDWKASTTLYLGADNFAPLTCEVFTTAAPAGARDDDHMDFAVARLDAGTISKLSGAKFITEDEIVSSTIAVESRIYTCLGYPNSKNKVPFNSRAIAPSLGRYTGISRLASSLPKIANDRAHILINHDAKFSRDASGARVNSISLTGFSGGAIIDVGGASEPLDAQADPKVAAMLIEGYAQEKVILSTRLRTILDAVRPHLKASAHADNPTVEAVESPMAEPQITPV